jgi:hypothetical protein
MWRSNTGVHGQVLNIENGALTPVESLKKSAIFHVHSLTPFGWKAGKFPVLRCVVFPLLDQMRWIP